MKVARYDRWIQHPFDRSHRGRYRSWHWFANVRRPCPWLRPYPGAQQAFFDKRL